jgi:hypothetical protein
MRAGTAMAGLVLAAGLLAGCSGDDGDDGDGSSAPTNARLEEFCETFDGLFDQVLSEDVAGDQAAMVRALRDWARDLEEVGTPDDIPDDARRGFELFVEQALEIDEDASLAELERLGEDLSAADQADGDAFSDWAQDSCPLDVPSLP